MNDFLTQFDTVTITLLSLSIILLAGFLVTRITKRLKLPNVSGYIIAGILIGPYVLNLIPKSAIEGMSFVGDIALAFIAFDVGKFMRKEIFLKSGRQAIVITIFESMIPGIMISLTMFYLFKYDLSFSLLLGAISTATAPASTMMTINEYKARGEFVYTLLQVVALDDVICLILFSIASAVISAQASGSLESSHVIMPIIYNIVSMIAGFLAGVVL